MSIFKNIKNRLVKKLPDKIIIDNKEYFLEEGQDENKTYYYIKYCDKKGIVPVINSDTAYYCLYMVDNIYSEAKNKIYKMLNNARKHFPGIDEALNNLA